MDKNTQQPITIGEMISQTVKDNSGRVVDNITYNSAFTRRFSPTPPKRNWVQQLWSQLLDAWPLQWKRRSDGWDD